MIPVSLNPSVPPIAKLLVLDDVKADAVREIAGEVSNVPLKLNVELELNALVPLP